MDPIPWYKSNVLRALLVGFIAFALKQAGLADQFPNVDTYVGYFLDLMQFGAGVWAAWARIKQPTPPVVLSKDSKPPNVQPVLAAIALMFVTLPLLGGCESLGFTKRQTIEQRAAALLGDFNLYQKASLQVGTDATVTPDVRRAVLDAAIAAKEPADQLDKALLQYRDMKRLLDAGETIDQKVAIAAANLQSWIRQVTPLVTSLRSLVEGVKK